MLFDKEFLQDVIYSNDVVSSIIIDHGRWTVTYEKVFRHEGKYYQTKYCVGATEFQDWEAYQEEPDMIECPEVVPVERVVVRYEPVV